MSAIAASRTVLIGFVGGATLYLGNKWNKREQVKASWTSHHNTPEPLYKWDRNWDKRHPGAEEKSTADSTAEGGCGDEKVKKPTATRNILLIRHGQYEMNGEGDEQRILTALGREQAKQTGERLRALDVPFSKIVYSTMARAQETGNIISSCLPEDIPVQHCSLLREGAPIPPEPSSPNYRPEAQQFFQDGARIEAAFRKYIHRASVNQEETSYEVVVCHANVIRYIVCRALQLPPEAWLRMSLHNGSITWLTVRPSGNVSLRALGDCGFMSAEQLTTT